jgi:hypothetical protein
MADLIEFMDREGVACWARFRLDSGDSIWLGVAEDGVVVEQFDKEFTGTKLFGEEDAVKRARVARALADQFAGIPTPPEMKDPVLLAFTAAILLCSSPEEVQRVLGQAVNGA